MAATKSQWATWQLQLATRAHPRGKELETIVKCTRLWGLR